MYYVIKIIKRS